MQNLFYECCEEGDIEQVKRLLPQVNDPSANNNRAFKSAAWGRHIDVVKLLLSDPRFNPKADKWYRRCWLLELFAEEKNNTIVKLLLLDPRVRANRGHEINKRVVIRTKKRILLEKIYKATLEKNLQGLPLPVEIVDEIMSYYVNVDDTPGIN